MGRQDLTIGRVAQQAGTKVETVRFYEKLGLLPAPRRTKGNYRTYEIGHLNRLNFIRRARGLGFSLDQIRELLALSDDQARSCEAIDAIAKEHRADVESKIKDLQLLKRELDRMIDQCGCGVVADCRIIDSLSPQR